MTITITLAGTAAPILEDKNFAHRLEVERLTNNVIQLYCVVNTEFRY